MEYEGLDATEMNAEENQWLSVTYTAKKYLFDEQQEMSDTSAKKIKHRQDGGFFKKMFSNTHHAEHQKAKKSSVWMRIAVGLAVLVLLFGGFFVADNFFEGQLYTTAKEAFLTSAFSFTTSQPPVNEIEIPFTVNIETVENGVITFSGGSVLLSFTDGTVSSIDNLSITVKIDENTSIVYDGIIESFVEVGSTVSVYQVLGSYEASACASIIHNGEIVVNVVGSESTVQWSV